MATIKAPRAFLSSSFICHSCRQRLLPATSTRAFSSTQTRPAEEPLGRLGGFQANNRGRPNRNNDSSSMPSISDLLDRDTDSFANAHFAHEMTSPAEREKPYRLHVYATKHNTHLTFVQPSRPASQTASSGVSGTSASAKDQSKMVDVLLSLSAGNIGFRKAGRGSYDAAYQLGAFALKQMQEKGMLRDMHSLQVVMRGFGAGREAITKIILGSEGRFIRNKITSVVDATRLKQGGPRSKKPRRLG
ncbi:37S ribosomal protein S18, mitochondrial [Pseudocercospora fuligena]|uniref:Small ribosomal subunit protein uS11m n=1 Tax=Pseudocercospora fuligena TaxID=685502 RepID=A0A8H6RIQ8_9PEZI|nr:37S ribosomal protein S18, mitochondrial [Pseudocercospora fuligena]